MKAAEDVQSEDEGEEEAEQERSDLRVRRHGGDGLADGGVVEREPHAHDEVREASAVGREADGPVPAEEVERRAEDVPRDLDQDLGRDERGPAVHPAVALAHLEDVAHVDERDLQLVRERDGDDHGHEDGEEVVLGALDGRLGLEEREADEERRRDVQRDLRDEVHRVAPVRLGVALQEQAHLVEPRRRVLALEPGLDRGLAAALGVDRLELVLDADRLGGLLPGRVPVDVRRRGRAGTDSLKDVLSPKQTQVS